jgi:nucleotide-binding universal stress UspA family protein
LIPLNTYPEPTPVAAARAAVALAGELGARATALACEVRIKGPGSLIERAMLDVPGLVATEAQKSADNAAHLLDAFRREAEQRGVAHEALTERCAPAELADICVAHARLHDLTIVPVMDGEYIDRWQVNAVIFGSGRPTLVIPQAPERLAARAFDTVVVAWDGGRAAARAIADALPILSRAKQVFVLSVTNEKALGRRSSGADLAAYLARHDVRAAVDTVDAEGRGIGDILRTHLLAREAGLLVMGAYGHSRLRDFVLGGATRSMLARPPLPILMSH